MVMKHLTSKLKRVKLCIMKFRQKYFSRFTPSLYFTQILSLEGIQVGAHTKFFAPNSQRIDRERPWMLRIGDFCKISAGCTILTHDYSRSVTRMYSGDIIGESGVTTIGDNVFIGMHSIVLMGSKIGDNVIIGAGSVVSGMIPSNVVAAGNPCKVIMTLDEHIARRKARQIESAFLYFNTFVDYYHREPSVKEMGPFFPLFLERSRDAVLKEGVNVHPNGDDSEDLIFHFLESEPAFSSYDEFKKEAYNNRNNGLS